MYTPFYHTGVCTRGGAARSPGRQHRRSNSQLCQVQGCCAELRRHDGSGCSSPPPGAHCAAAGGLAASTGAPAVRRVCGLHGPHRVTRARMFCRTALRLGNEQLDPETFLQMRCGAQPPFLTTTCLAQVVPGHQPAGWRPGGAGASLCGLRRLPAQAGPAGWCGGVAGELPLALTLPGGRGC